ncbi:hypothetical protein ASE35_18400 [Lysobacter sp. Root916]|uniref:hypothetical protein n=1 Tax=Lysobacter sp. Root916 TaxID=1736606 RepID=UPI00070A2FD1|nr:hypothetical protein [Lysobacter sp. Root916]KRD30095.1 hypothetical protein ASE35_18400 [Lysobacter sp. Root916]
MHAFATKGLVLAFCAVLAVVMAASGESPLSIVLLLAAVLLLLLGTDRVFTRSRARRNLPQDFSVTFADLRALQRADWLRLFACTFGGIALAIAALADAGRP